MENQVALNEFADIQKKMQAYTHALGVLYFDAVTIAPPDSAEGRGAPNALLTGELYELQNGTRTREAMEFLKKNAAGLTPRQRREVEVFERDYEHIACIPKDEYVEYQSLLNTSAAVWRQAKAENDFASFAPILEKIFDTERHFAELYDPSTEPYNVMLDCFERGMTMKKADSFFTSLRESLVPLLRKVAAAPQPENGFLYRPYPIHKQREFSDYLMEVMNIDRRRCAITETEHPFTTSFNKRDVRITTHYYENDFTSSMYSVIHEGGHAIYMLNTGDEYEGTCLADGASMGIHESQSRLYENLIGRSEEFLALVYPKLREMYPAETEGVTPRMLYEAVNKSTPSLIRIQADELTYPLHIMVRYDLEKALVGGTLSVWDLPEAWAAKMKEYLGVDVPNDTNGVLQDSHWSSGQIGYFPSYALGSAYGAQIIAKMGESFDVSSAVRAGDIPRITAWLTERIYGYGRLYDPDELIQRACGAPFDPQYFVRYLEQKYTDIYKL